MEMIKPAAICALAMSCALLGCGKPDPKVAADTIFTGGDIVTINDAQPSVEALAVKDGKILAVGTRIDIEKNHKGTTTTAVDLGGKTLLPSFIDPHSHYINALSVANQVNVFAPPAGPGKDVPAIVAELVKFRDARKIPEGELIIAYGYDETSMPGGRMLNRDDLDKDFPNHPVLVGHVSLHGGVLNSAALKKFGFSAATKTPPGGIIVRKTGTNEPYG
ncbi:MAG: amidohydrolase family protein, partial [Burkholderiaceae bacterium]